MGFRDWQEIEAADPIRLPINGKEYALPAVGHLDAIRLREDVELIRQGKGSAIPNEEFLRMLLGDQLDAMYADNVPDKAILLAATVAHTDAFSGRLAAEQVWERGQDPEALAAGIKAAVESLITSRNTPPRARTSSTKKPASSRSTRSRSSSASKSSGSRSSTSRS